MISAGFAETGETGARLQEQLLAKVRAHGMRLIGPNCLRIISTAEAVRLNATFTGVDPPPGRVAMSSDSGALSLDLHTLARHAGR